MKRNPSQGLWRERNLKSFYHYLDSRKQKSLQKFQPKKQGCLKQGFEVAKRFHEKQAASGPSQASTSKSNPENPQTPGLENTNVSAGTRKRLFSPGTIGVLPRHAKSSKQQEDHCAKCHKTSPFKKKDWSGIWIMCDNCAQWYHKGLVTTSDDLTEKD